MCNSTEGISLSPAYLPASPLSSLGLGSRRRSHSPSSDDNLGKKSLCKKQLSGRSSRLKQADRMNGDQPSSQLFGPRSWPFIWSSVLVGKPFGLVGHGLVTCRMGHLHAPPPHPLAAVTSGRTLPRARLRADHMLFPRPPPAAAALLLHAWFCAMTCPRKPSRTYSLCALPTLPPRAADRDLSYLPDASAHDITIK